MTGKSLSNETAERVLQARRAQPSYKLLDSQTETVGTGKAWDERRADRVRDTLQAKIRQLQSAGKRVDGFEFDRCVCAILHKTLNLPHNLVAADGFWRWLAVEKFADIIEARVPSSKGYSLSANYGIGSRSRVRNRIAIIWYRADMLYDENASDPYHLSKYQLHADFVESGIIRHRYGWCRNLARALVRFQYRDPNSRVTYLHSDSTRANGIREMYKRLQRLHSVISFEFLSEEELGKILEENSRDLLRA